MNDFLIQVQRCQRNCRVGFLVWIMCVTWGTIWGLAGCSLSPQPQPLQLGDPVWQNGERSVYQITNREEQRAGNAIYTVAQGQGETAWIFTRQINDISATEQTTVSVKMPGYLPVHSELMRTVPQGKQQATANYQRGQIDIALVNQQGATVYERVNVPSDVRDERTLLPLLRTLPLQQSYAAFINSFLPVTGQVERTALQVLKREQISVPAGTFDTWVVDAETNDRTTRVWIGSQPPHPVVKFIDGRSQGTFELSEFIPAAAP